MTDQATIAIEIPKALWMSANDRTHWAAKSRQTKELRRIGKSAAIKAGSPRFSRCAVWVYIGYPRGGKADPSNAFPTVKALIDGFTDAGMWPDDNSDHLIGPTFDRDKASEKPGVHTIRFVFIEQEVRF